MRSGRRHALVALAIAVGASACASLLGVEEVGYAPDADAGSDVIGSGDSPLGESAPPDGGADAPCTQLATDPKNCGRCGHSCFGGECRGGVCQPVVVATDERGCGVTACATTLVADDQAVYWTTYDLNYTEAGVDATPGHVAKSTCGETCAPKEVLVPGVYRGGAMSQDTTHVYFATGILAGSVATMYRCQKDGCGQAPAALCGPTSVAGTTTHNGQIYWTDDMASGSVFASSTNGCDAGLPPPLAFVTDYTVAVAVDDSSIFASTGNRVVRSPADGGTLVPISPTGTGTYFIALDSQFIYWTQFTSGGSVLKCGRGANCSTAAPGQIALSQSSPGPIAVDSSGVYWVNLSDPSADGGSAIVACAGPSCADGGPAVLATNQGATTAIAVNKDSVYWANSRNGTIMRLAKP